MLARSRLFRRDSGDRLAEHGNGGEREGAHQRALREPLQGFLVYQTQLGNFENGRPATFYRLPYDHNARYPRSALRYRAGQAAARCSTLSPPPALLNDRK